MPPKRYKLSSSLPKITEIMDTAAGAKAVRTADGTVISLEDSQAVLQRQSLKTPGIVAALHESAREAVGTDKLDEDAQTHDSRPGLMNADALPARALVLPRPSTTMHTEDRYVAYPLIGIDHVGPTSPTSWGDAYSSDIPQPVSMKQVFRYALKEQHNPYATFGSTRVITQSLTEETSTARPTKRARLNFDLLPDASPISAAITPATLSTRKPRLKFTQRQEDKIAEGRKTAEWSFEAVFEAPTVRDGSRPPTGAIARLADIFSGKEI
jgi:hypothetical protein